MINEQAKGGMMIGNAYERYKVQYDNAGKAYHCAEREYYSTGCVQFDVEGAPIVLAGQYDRYILHASAGSPTNGGQLANLFSYKIGDPMGGANVSTAAGTGSRIADVSDTNLVVAYETNDEDFAARGIFFGVKNIRLEFTPAAAYTALGLPASFTQVVTTGTGYLDDPGSHIMPPEIDSPLVLQDVMGRAISRVLRVREVWDGRASDDIALARRMGPGGSDSYLKSLGQPTTHNVLRLDPGLMWNRRNDNEDTRFNLECSLMEDVWMIVSWPQALVADGTAMGTLTKVSVDYTVGLVGHAFYYPSRNA